MLHLIHMQVVLQGLFAILINITVILIRDASLQLLEPPLRLQPCATLATSFVQYVDMSARGIWVSFLSTGVSNAQSMQSGACELQRVQPPANILSFRWPLRWALPTLSIPKELCVFLICKALLHSGVLVSAH